MTTSVHTAVILAAGLGSRLGDLKENKPKAFVKVGGQSLIDRSVQSLIKKGITNIIIGTGYLSEQFDALAKDYPQIRTCRNKDYDKTGSMYTLYLLRELITAPFLLLEGDLLYEPAALSYLLEDETKNIILASDATHSGDEVFIQSNTSGFLEQMNKDKNKLSNISGELVGISKLSKETLTQMCEFAETQYAQNQYAIHYEDTMVGVAKSVNLFVKVVKDMAWCEIDDPSHFQRAVSEVYPKILKRS